MRRMMAVILGGVLLAATSTALAEDESKAVLKLGGGILYNNKITIGDKWAPSGHVALDINVPGKPVAFSPFVEGYRKSGKWSSSAGLDFIIKPKVSSDKVSPYFGVGGGVFHVPGIYKGAIDALVGLDIKASNAVSIFIEPRYIWAASSLMNGVAAHAGLAFHLGGAPRKAEAAAPARPATPPPPPPAPATPPPPPAPEKAETPPPPPAPEKQEMPAPEKKETLQTEVGKAIVLEGIVFATGKADITEASADILDKAYETLRQNPDISVEIRGYTDNVGSRASNMALSQRRADAVRAFLVQKGIAESRITAKGFGPDNPVAPNTTPEGRQKNRRIEFYRTK